MSFLTFRFAVTVAVLLGLWAIVRFRSVHAGLGLVISLGLLIWLYTWIPLQQPFGLQPGTEVSFDFAIVSSGAARGEALEGWVVGRRNPRPAWSALWYGLSPGDPARARALLAFFPLLMMAALPGIVFWSLRGQSGQDPWVALSASFTAVLGSSVPLDALQPFSFFERGVFFAPYRALGVVLALVALGLAWRGGRRWVPGGLALGLLGWLDVSVFFWAILVLAFTAGLARRNEGWLALVLGVVLATPQMVFLLRGELLARIPSREEVLAFRTAFQDVLIASFDMGWIFFLAIAALVLLWKRGRDTDLACIAIVSGSYTLWTGAAVLFHWRPFSEPEAVFHLLRFGVALVAGAGGLELARHAVARLKESGFLEGRLLRGVAPEPLAFVLVFVFLLPVAAPFVWRPMMIDPRYYPSTLEWDTSVQSLERWVRANTDADEVVLAGEDTGEWIASLTGRRAWIAERVLPHPIARERRRQLRRFFVSGTPEAMRELLETSGASVLVLDQSLRGVYFEFDEKLLESSELFEKMHQIGDRYSIYRVR